MHGLLQNFASEIRGRNLNSGLNLTEIKKLTFEAFLGITEDQWLKYCKHVIGTESEYWQSDSIVEQKIASMFCCR